MSSAVPNRKRWWLWLPLLALAFWLAFFGDKTPTGSVVSVPTNTTLAPKQAAAPLALPIRTNTPSATLSSAAPTPAAPTALDPLIPRNKLILGRKTVATTGSNLFASGTWSPPPPPPPPPVKPPPPPPPVAPPAPTAPKLPFTFVGKKLEAKMWEVFLARGEQSFVVREGSVIENTYRIDQISPPNISLTYLPLGQSQSLSIGASE